MCLWRLSRIGFNRPMFDGLGYRDGGGGKEEEERGAVFALDISTDFMRSNPKCYEIMLHYVKTRARKCRLYFSRGSVY